MSANSDRLSALAHSLVQSIIPGTSQDHLRASHLRNWALRELKNDSQGGTRREWQDAKKSLAGLAYTARIKVQDDLADALNKLSDDLAVRFRSYGGEWEEGLPISISNIAEHIQFLFNLSEAPSTSAQRYAQAYLSRKPSDGPTPDQILYQQIMSDPFEGDHWGTGHDEEVVEGWFDSSDDDETGSGSSGASDTDVVTPHSNRAVRSSRHPAESGPNAQREEEEERLRLAREVLRKQDDSAYWRSVPTELERSRDEAFGWREISTDIAPLSLEDIPSHERRMRVINAVQFQRELLHALSGRPNVLIDWSEAVQDFTISPRHPYLRHHSRAANLALLETLRERAGVANRLRIFAEQAVPTRHRTKAAFVETVRSCLQGYALRMSELESDILRGEPATTENTDIDVLKGTSTPLQLLMLIENEWGNIFDSLVPCLDLADSPIVLLNTLYAAYSSSALTGDLHATQRFLAVFIATAKPTWSSLGRWLTHGMPIPSVLSAHEDRAIVNADELDDEARFDPEFFITRDRDVSWADEDFWECAWVVAEDGWPIWIEGKELRDAIVEAGKARGLLRGLTGTGTRQGQAAWKGLPEVFLHLPNLDHADPDIATEIPNSLMEDYLRPFCDQATSELRRVLEQECGLMAHLQAIEAAMYMRCFEVMETWTTWLYTQLRSSKRTWADFQTLTNTYRETILASGETWMNAPALRLSLTSRLKDQVGTAALALIRLDCQVPFPLSQLFSFTSMELRSDVFTALLQLGYCRFLLSSSSGRSSRGQYSWPNQSIEERRLSWLKHRLTWVLDTVWIWLHDRVLDLQAESFRKRLDAAATLGDMIQIELEHTRSIRKYCFLHDSTSIVNGCIHDVLDIAQQFADITNTPTSGGVFLPATGSASRPQSHVQGRSRARARRRLRPRLRSGVSSDEFTGEDAEIEPATDAVEAIDSREQQIDASLSFAQLDAGQKLDKLRVRLQEAVRVFKDGIEDLALGEGVNEAEREVWAMLSFALEDWRG